jgi:hypothetical protein
MLPTSTVTLIQALQRRTALRAIVLSRGQPAPEMLGAVEELPAVSFSATT